MKPTINRRHLPNIVFKQMPLELESDMFFDFLQSDWSNRITDKYPQFLAIKEIKSKGKRFESIKSEICKIRSTSEEKMSIGLGKIKSDWQKNQEKILNTLSDIIQAEWLPKEITAYISLNPICPRYLNSLSFSICPDNKYINKTITHELSHFLYFKKFNEVFPEISQKQYESPHKEWILSELVAVIILDDSRIIKIIGNEGNNFYDSHKILKIDNVLATDIIRDIYKKSVIKRNDFSEFIKNGMEVINRVSL